MNQRFQRWMYGRNGMDQLARASLILSLILIFITMFTGSNIIYLLGVGFLVYGYFRVMSRNVMKRRYENEKYVRMTDHVKYQFRNFHLKDIGWKTKAFFTELGRKIRYGSKQNQAGAQGFNSYQGQTNSDVKYKVFKCPNCKQKVRVPKGHGKIEITCPRCRANFIKHT